MAKGKAKALKSAAAKVKKSKPDSNSSAHDAAVEQLACAADAEQHLTATHQAVVGLSNLGNTCFFNSSVQLLLSCSPLQQMLAQKDHVISRGPLGFALQQATLHAAGRSSMSKGGSNSTYNPQSLLSAVCCHAPVFKGKQQHDAHELMRMLLDGLQTQEQRYKDLSRRGPGKGLPALTNGIALANGHAHKQDDPDLSTTSSSSSTSSSDSSSSAGSSGQGWPASDPADSLNTQQQNGTLPTLGADASNGTANGTPAGTASSTSNSSSTSSSSSSSGKVEAYDTAYGTAVSGADGVDALCNAYLSTSRPGPTLDSLPDGDPAAAGMGPTVAAASGSAAASSTGVEGGSYHSSSSSGSEATVAPAAAGTDMVQGGEAAADSPYQRPALADCTAANILSSGANGALSSSSGACAECGCGLEQQQGAPNPLQRKSLLPPVPPTSAGSSSVEAVFGGVLSSYITCTACGYCSISYEPFLDLSLPIPLGNGTDQGLMRKGSLLSRLANRATGKKKGAAAKDAAADGSKEGSNTAGTDTAAAAAAAAATAAEAAATAAAAAAAAAQGKKKTRYKEKRRLQQVASAAAKEANKLARLAKKKQQEQEHASSSGRGDVQQQGAAAAAAVVDPAVFEDIPPTNYYTLEQIELSETLRASAESLQDQQQGEDQQQFGFVHETHDQQEVVSEPAQQQQTTAAPAAAAAAGRVSPVPGGGCSPAASLTRVTAASDEGASSISGLTDVGGASGSPPTAAVSCWGGTWGDMQPQRSPAPPSSTSSSHLQPLSNSSGFPPSISDTGAPAGGSDGSSTSPKGAAAPKTLHRRFGSLGSLSALTSGAKGGLSSLFAGRHSRQGSKDKDSLDKLAAAALNDSTNGGAIGAQRSQSAGVTSPSSRGGLKGFLLNRAPTPPPPRPSSALGVVSEAGEGPAGARTGRISIPEDSPIDPVDQELPQQHNMQRLGSGPVFTPLGVVGDLSIMPARPETAAPPQEAAAAAANGAVSHNDSSGGVAANGMQAAAAAGGSAGVLPSVQQQLASSRLQRAFSDDAVVRLGSMRCSSSNSSGGGSSIAGEQQQQQQHLVPLGGSPYGLVDSAAAAADGDESVGILPSGGSSGAYANPFAAPSIQQQQGAAGDTSPQARGSSPIPVPATAVPVAPVQDPFAAAAVVGKGEVLAVQHCLATFFLREDVSWECPKEKALWKQRRLSAASGSRVSTDGRAPRSTDSGSGAGAAGPGVCAACCQQQQQVEGSSGGGCVAIAPAHPQLQQLLEEGGQDEGPVFKQVSFSDRQPQVHLVPGSVEQRGTDLAAALAGRRPFCRALSWGGASLLLTAQLGEVFLEGADAGPQLMLGLKAAGEGGVAMAPAARVLPGGSMHLGAVRLPDVQELCLSGEDSAALLQHWAQLVLNCMADLVHCEGGISGLRAMAAGGLSLLPGDSWRLALRRGYVEAGSLEGHWKVRGQLPPATSAPAAGAAGGDADAAGDAAQEVEQQRQQGFWEYPAGEADDVDDGPAAAAAQGADGVDAGSGIEGAGSVQAADSSCLSPAPSSVSAVASSPGVMQGSPQLQTAVAAGGDVGDDVFAMDEEGQNEIGSEQQAQGPHDQQAQGWQGDALSSASSSTLGGKAPRSGSCSLCSRDGEEGSTSTSRSVSLFRKVTLPPSTSAVAGEADADGSSNGAVAIQPPLPPAAASLPVNIKPLQGSPPAGVSVSPLGGVCGGSTPLGASSSLRRSSLRRRSSSCSRTAHKSYRIHLPPQVLLLHLKRFQHDGRGRLNKLDTAVKFEFELDLSPFMAENAPSSSSSSNGGQAAQQQPQGLMYDLVGLVVHMGTMRGGHYVAYVKRVHGAEASAEAGAAGGSTGSQGRAQWYYISDACVRAVGSSEVAAAQAYMMLYVRRPAKEQQQQGEQDQQVPEAQLHDCGL